MKVRIQVSTGVNMTIFRSERGFTLIEVVISMAVMAIGLLSMYVLQLTSIRGNSTAINITSATNSGANKIEEIFSQDYSAFTTGNYTQTEGLYTVDTEVTAGDTDNTKKIKVVINWREGGQMRTVTLNHLKAQLL